MFRRARHFEKGELFTADRAGFLRELRLSCSDAAALFSQTEGMYLVASEIAPVLPCPVIDTLLALPALFNPGHTAMRERRVQAFSRYLEAVHDAVIEQICAVAALKARSGDWQAWFTIRVWLRSRVAVELATLEFYGVAYRAGVRLKFERRTAALARLVALLDC